MIHFSPLVTDSSMTGLKFFMIQTPGHTLGQPWKVFATCKNFSLFPFCVPACDAVIPQQCNANSVTKLVPWIILGPLLSAQSALLFSQIGQFWETFAQNLKCQLPFLKGQCIWQISGHLCKNLVSSYPKKHTLLSHNWAMLRGISDWI